MYKMIVITLKQDVPGNYAADGMDIAMCEINLKENKVRFSGAHMPLYHISNNEFFEHKASRFPIGGMQYKKAITYIDHEIDAQPNDLFFIFSDGFQDQFGGPENEKYGSLQLQTYLLENRHLPIEEIKNGLKNEFLEWKKDGKQMDDILIIGFKLL